MRKKALYFECTSGISGDMTVAALLDLGASEQVLRDALTSLGLPGYRLQISRVTKSGLDICDFDVQLTEAYENHDHDMEYLHGHEHDTTEHMKEQHSHNHHACEHRGLGEVTAIINGGQFSEQAKRKALEIFDILAEAESKVHGVPKDKVSFHEVGAIDSIIDIVSVAVCMDDLGYEEIIAPKLTDGGGVIRCQHGVIPVPVPAVCEIVKAHQLELELTGEEGEYVTPTGAAIVAAYGTRETLPERFSVIRTGMGAGKRDYKRPGILRVMEISYEQIEDSLSDGEGHIYKLESNMDDCTGENLGYVSELLFAAGARDVNYTPAYMKKNRPGYQLNVICMEEDVPRMEEIIFCNTTTIGIRKMRMERSVLDREIIKFETSLGEAQVKVVSCGDTKKIYPEYESIRQICKATNKSYTEVYHQIMEEYVGLSDERWSVAKAQNTQYEKLLVQIMEALAMAIDAKDSYTNGHSIRVAEYAKEIARRLGMSEMEQNEIYYMGLLHDIGKIGVPDKIIVKKTGLTEREYDKVKLHPVIGGDILKNISAIPGLSTGARWHHERYDGTGYPDGMKGEEIPLEARIIAVADAYDAMASKRSYRDVIPQSVIRLEIEGGRGTQFDETIADIMLGMIDDDVNFDMREK